jgi:hypothetical protein
MMTIMMRGCPSSANPTCMESAMVEWIINACLYAAALALGWLAAGIYGRLTGR